MSTVEKLKSEVMAGGSVVERADDELVGGWRGALGVLGVAALIGSLAFFSIWWFVFAVGVLLSITMHELGHFATARWTGMKATQFFIGFGQRLWSFRRGETEYGIRAIPAGAFVRIIGMNSMDDVEQGDEDRTYRSKSYPRRMLVISAGSIMHMLIAIVLLFSVYAIDGETVYLDGVEVAELTAGGPAQLAGFQTGDVITDVGGEFIDGTNFGTAVRKNGPGDVVAFEVIRDGSPITIDVELGTAPAEIGAGTGAAFVGVSSVSRSELQDHSLLAAAGNATTDIFPQSWEMTKGALKVLNPVTVFTHVAGTNDDLATRPTTLIGVTGLSDDVGDSQGIMGIVYLLAILNVFVGVFNMLPLLPLDGGHAAIATYERVRERNGQRYYADVAKMMPFAMAVMTLLLFLFASGLYLDVTDPIG